MIVLMEGAGKGGLAARGQGLGLHPHHPPSCLPALKRPLGDQGSSPGSTSECLCESPPVGLDFPL